MKEKGIEVMNVERGRIFDNKVEMELLTIAQWISNIEGVPSGGIDGLELIEKNTSVEGISAHINVENVIDYFKEYLEEHRKMITLPLPLLKLKNAKVIIAKEVEHFIKWVAIFEETLVAKKPMNHRFHTFVDKMVVKLGRNYLQIADIAYL